MKKSILTAGVVIALAILLAIALAAYSSIRNAEESSRHIVASSRFLTQLEEVLSQLKDAESGQRGYVINGDPSFLDQYDSATHALPGLLDELERMSVDDPRRREDAGRLRELVSERHALLRKAILLRNQGNPPATIGTAVGGEGKRLMDEARALVATMKKGEEASLERSIIVWEGKTRHTLFTTAIGSAIAIGLLAIAFILVRRELNARELAQTRAEQYGAEIEDLYNNAPCGYHSIDAAGIITRANDTELGWLGYSRDEMIGKPFADLLTSRSQQKFKEHFEKFKAEGSIDDVVFDLLRKNGSILVVSLSATSVRDAAGRFTMSRSTMFDITARREAELRVTALNAELERGNAQLASMNKELEGFSYSVSHDLRVPLRAIDGYSRMLEEDIEHKLEPEDRRKIKVIRDNARKMGQLIDDLLSFSRLGRKPIESAPIDMSSLVGEAYRLIEDGEARLPALEIAALPDAQGDRTLLRQVWLNLLSNAVKFTAKRERPQIQVGGCKTHEGCLYWVRDNGAGFEMQYVDKLFGVFQRLHGQHEFAGTGVGLAIVKRVVTRHAGRVWAEGEVEAGATFYFTLPEGVDHG